MSRRKEPKPYTLKQRRGDRPYQYSEQYRAWHAAIRMGREGDVRHSHREWMRRYSPDLEMRSLEHRAHIRAGISS